jgi:hypothetical protein
MAIVAPPTSKTAARLIRAELVMIFSKPISSPSRFAPPKEQPTGIGCSQMFAWLASNIAEIFLSDCG